MKKVKVVLTKDCKELGNVGDVIEVRPGYARNFLIPKGLAIEERNAERYKKLREEIERQRQEAITKAKALSNLITGQELIFTRKVGEGGKLFGSVSQNDVISALKEKGIEIQPHMVRLSEPIKTLGKFSVTIRLHSEVQTSVSVAVVDEGSKKQEKAAKSQKKESKQEMAQTKKASSGKKSEETVKKTKKKESKK
ncbi:MAG: 50S ribosomal protein L9 [Deltaproteobacteria bacterium]|nr:50S ribosomal protein L9 [Deltaproteobacteria bacterium]MCX7953032.1 50S ribosomal protein L9 [Deltaproteobacteria bacterium]